jgi:hypothetical protein
MTTYHRRNPLVKQLVRDISPSDPETVIKSLYASGHAPHKTTKTPQGKRSTGYTRFIHAGSASGKNLDALRQEWHNLSPNERIMWDSGHRHRSGWNLFLKAYWDHNSVCSLSDVAQIWSQMSFNERGRWNALSDTWVVGDPLPSP